MNINRTFDIDVAIAQVLAHHVPQASEEQIEAVMNDLGNAFAGTQPYWPSKAWTKAAAARAAAPPESESAPAFDTACQSDQQSAPVCRCCCACYREPSECRRWQ